jgi:hypothetical protein
MDWQGIPNTGQVQLIFGTRDLPPEIPLEDPASVGLRSLRLVASEPELKLGYGLERAGDLDGDGRADLAIAASAPGTEDGLLFAGRVYLILGIGALAARGEVNIAEIGHSVPGAVIHGAWGDPRSANSGGVGDSLGYDTALEPGGDLDGDGIDDLLLGAPFASRGMDRNGAVYILLGRRGLGGELYAARPEELGVEIVAPHLLERLTRGVAATGDVDGDGYGDFLVGAGGDAFQGEGIAYLIYGRPDWPRGQVPMQDLRHFAIKGTFSYPQTQAPRLGMWVDGPGDLNGDGFADLIVSKFREAVRYGNGAGAVFVVLGGPSLPEYAEDRAIGTPELPGLKIQGRDMFYQLGQGGAAGGDLDGDGRGDVVVTSPWRDFVDGSQPPPPSEIYLFFGGDFDFSGQRLFLGAVEPAEGSTAGGTRVLLGGGGFESDLRVFFGGVEADRVFVATSAEAEAVVPEGAALGAVDVEVVSGASRVKLERGFTYREAPAHPDLYLDPARLREAGFRTAVISGVGHHLFEGDVDEDGLGDMAILAWERFDERSHVWLVRGRPRWPAELGFEDLFNEASLIESEPDPSGFGRYVSLGGDFDGDGHGDLAIGGTLVTPVLDVTTAAGKAYVVLSEGGDWSSVVSLEAALGEGRALTFPHDACGQARVATLSTPAGEGVLATSHLFCTGLAAELKLYRGPFEPAVRSPEPVAVIRGDPERLFINPQLGHDDSPLRFGAGITAAGDVNGDGQEDLLVSAYGAIGECYVILMSEAVLSFDGTIVELIERGHAVRIRRGIGLTEFGFDVSAGGDFNGDALADLALSANGGGGDKIGESFVVFGSRDFGGSLREVDLLERSPGHLRIVGEYPGDVTGTVFGIGDWNGDGFDDVAVFGLFNRNQTPGHRAYVVFGEAEPPREIRLRTLGDRGFRIWAMPGRELPGGRENRPVARGDFDGDRHADLAIADAEENNQALEARRITIIFGRRLAGGVFLRGEANGDGRVDLSDAVSILGYLFLGTIAPACPDAADVDDSGALDLSDAVYLLNHLFLGSRQPPEPYPAPGRDPTSDPLACP